MGDKLGLEDKDEESKARRVSYTAGFKLQVIDYAKKNGNRAAARLFHDTPSESTIRDWIKKEERLKSLPETKCNFRQCPPKWPALEKKLYNWVLEQEKEQNALTARMILNEGIRMSAELCIDDFHGTRTWCQRFINRHQIDVVKKIPIPRKKDKKFVKLKKINLEEPFLLQIQKKHGLN